jgi:HD superfamily phosphohydrolase
MAAALVHDVGHGPFSHAFEAAGKKFHRSQKHELWTVDIIRGDTKVGEVLDGFKSGFRDQVAQIIADKMPQDIYGSIVSSQFDADRLDYVRRDRFMAGVDHGEFDFSWLMANLEVDQIPLAIDDDQIGIVPGLVLGRKAFQAAEAYVLGLFHLYFAVYFHKTTRSAEKMLTGLLLRVGELVQEGKAQDCELSQHHPLLSFISSGTVSDYLKLDDFVLWAAFREMLKAKDLVVGELARRLLHRKPYKAIEISAHFEHRGGDAAVATFKGRLNAAQRAGEIDPSALFSDTASRTPYKWESFETPAALSKVLIRRADGTGMQDLRDSSSVVRALEETSVYRLYVRDEEAKAKVEKLMEGI